MCYRDYIFLENFYSRFFFWFELGESYFFCLYFFGFIFGFGGFDVVERVVVFFLFGVRYV